MLVCKAARFDHNCFFINMAMTNDNNKKSIIIIKKQKRLNKNMIFFCNISL